MRIEWNTLPKLFEAKTDKCIFGDGIFSRTSKTLIGGFEDYFVISYPYRGAEEYENEIRFGCRPFQNWNRKLQATLVPCSKIKEFKKLYLPNILRDSIFVVDRFKELTGESLYMTHFARDERVYIGESEDGYRGGGTRTRHLNAMDVFRVDDPTLFEQIQKELEEKRNAFEKEHFQTLTLIDFSNIELEIDEESYPSLLLNKGEYERHGLTKELVAELARQVGREAGLIK